MSNLNTTQTWKAIRANLNSLGPATLERWEKDDERRTDLRFLLEASEELVAHAKRESGFESESEQ